MGGRNKRLECVGEHHDLLEEHAIMMMDGWSGGSEEGIDGARDRNHSDVGRPFSCTHSNTDADLYFIIISLIC